MFGLKISDTVLGDKIRWMYVVNTLGYVRDLPRINITVGATKMRRMIWEIIMRICSTACETRSKGSAQLTVARSKAIMRLNRDWSDETLYSTLI